MRLLWCIYHIFLCVLSWDPSISFSLQKHWINIAMTLLIVILSLIWGQLWFLFSNSVFCIGYFPFFSDLWMCLNFSWRGEVHNKVWKTTTHAGYFCNFKLQWILWRSLLDLSVGIWKHICFINVCYDAEIAECAVSNWIGNLVYYWGIRSSWLNVVTEENILWPADYYLYGAGLFRPTAPCRGLYAVGIGKVGSLWAEWGKDLFRASLLGWWMVIFCFTCLSLVQISFFYKDTGHVGLGPTTVVSFNLNDLFKYCPKKGYSLGAWGSGLQYTNFGGTQLKPSLYLQISLNID